jgi:hypothetical protein
MNRLDQLEKMIAERAILPSQFRPMAHYDRETDSLEFLVTNESYYAECIDGLVTIYSGQESGDVVGLLFKKISKFCKDFLKHAPGFKTEIQDDRIKVEHLFTAKIWATADDQNDARMITYRKLRKVAEENDVEADIDNLAELVES